MDRTRRNRYGDVYRLKQINENTYQIVGELKHWRFGGKQGQQEIDINDLGMADPSGGPYMEVGMEIEGRKIKRISASGNLDNCPTVLYEVE